MTNQLDLLMERLRTIEAEIEVELAKRREELRYHMENRRIVFEKEVLELHRQIKTRLWRYLAEAHLLTVLTAPVIYAMIVPIILLDLSVMFYQAVCFPVYGIPAAPRLPRVRSPPPGLSQRDRETELRLLLLCQQHDRLCP